MRLYLSGPMRSYPYFNFNKFFEVASALSAQGHTLLNPAAHDCEVYPEIWKWEGFASGDTGKCPQFDLPTSLAWDFKQIIDPATDGIALMLGWEASSGAKAELFVAECVGKKVFFVAEQLGGWPTNYYLLGPVGETHIMKYPQMEASWNATKKSA